MPTIPAPAPNRLDAIVAGLTDLGFTMRASGSYRVGMLIVEPSENDETYLYCASPDAPAGEIPGIVSWSVCFAETTPVSVILTSIAAAILASPERARLDTDGTAKPRTQLVRHVPAEHCASGFAKAGDPLELRRDDGSVEKL